MKIKTLSAVFFSAFILLACSTAPELITQNSNGWRGPDRNGIFKETGLLKIWPSDGP